MPKPQKPDPLAERRAESKAWIAEFRTHVQREPNEQEPEYLTRVGTIWSGLFPDIAEANHQDARRMKPNGWKKRRPPSPSPRGAGR